MIIVPLGLTAGAVSTVELLDGTIAAIDLANNSVTECKIAACAVSCTKLADGAVVGAKLADGSVNAAKLCQAALQHSYSLGSFCCCNTINDDARWWCVPECHACGTCECGAGAQDYCSGCCEFTQVELNYNGYGLYFNHYRSEVLCNQACGCFTFDCMANSLGISCGICLSYSWNCYCSCDCCEYTGSNCIEVGTLANLLCGKGDITADGDIQGCCINATEICSTGGVSACSCLHLNGACYTTTLTQDSLGNLNVLVYDLCSCTCVGSWQLQCVTS